MKPGTGRTITAICSITTLAIAVVLLIYAAGAKLATIENKIEAVEGRLASIEDVLGDIKNGRPTAEAAGRGTWSAGDTELGYAKSLVRLLPFGSRDNTDGALVLYGDVSDPE